MDIIPLVDPELCPALEAVPAESGIGWDDLPGKRAELIETKAAQTAHLAASPHVTREDLRVPGPEDGPDVPIRIYRPAAAAGVLPALFWIHGGGMVLGSLEIDDLEMQRIVETLGCVAVSVEYRLAPEHPFPAPLEDCYAALKWTHGHAGDLHIDPGRIAAGGASAGSGLAAGLALLARDRGEVPLVFQWLIYPMLDDRNCTPFSQAILDPRVWNRESNLYGWRAYLGTEPGSDGVSPYAAPARAVDLRGLPPAYIDVGTVDLFLDEDVEYARRLAAAGVPVELHVYPGAYHGSEGAVPDAALSLRMVADRTAALQRALFPAE